MSAEMLRRAAALMRDRAESTPFEATLDRYDHGGGRLAVFTQPRELVADFYGDGGPREHYTSWHPTVALILADWLESVAGAMTPPGEDVVDAGREIHARDENHALAVARAYLEATS